MSAEDERDYRRALGRFATGVALVTVADGRGFQAITINSLTSVSLKPRLMLWCLGDKSDRYATFAEAAAFGVNVLGAEQQGLAARFAMHAVSGIEPELIVECAGVPVLAQALARFACKTVERRMIGDHLVVVGETLAYDAADGEALTYFQGRFGVAS